MKWSDSVSFLCSSREWWHCWHDVLKLRRVLRNVPRYMKLTINHAWNEPHCTSSPFVCILGGQLNKRVASAVNAYATMRHFSFELFHKSWYYTTAAGQPSSRQLPLSAIFITWSLLTLNCQNGFGLVSGPIFSKRRLLTSLHQRCAFKHTWKQTRYTQVSALVKWYFYNSRIYNHQLAKNSIILCRHFLASKNSPIEYGVDEIRIRLY